jgi:hypothetical protein
MQDGGQKQASINAKTSFEGDLLGIEYSPDETVIEILPTAQFASFRSEDASFRSATSDSLIPGWIQRNG